MADVGDKGKYKKKIRKVFHKVCTRVLSGEGREGSLGKDWLPYRRPSCYLSFQDGGPAGYVSKVVATLPTAAETNVTVTF